MIQSISNNPGGSILGNFWFNVKSRGPAIPTISRPAINWNTFRRRIRFKWTLGVPVYATALVARTWWDWLQVDYGD